MPFPFGLYLQRHFHLIQMTAHAFTVMIDGYDVGSALCDHSQEPVQLSRGVCNARAESEVPPGRA